MSAIKQFEAASIIANWNDIDLSQGLAFDTYLEVTPNAPRITQKIGNDGKASLSKMADRSATIKMTFVQNSETNQKIAAVYAAMSKIGAEIPVSPFTIIDKTGNSAHFVALNATLTEVPGHTFGSDMGEKTWTWVCESYIDSADPETTLQEISEYFK